MRTVLLPDPSNPEYFYNVLTASVVPRPIAWVSTISTDGIANLAPYSFYTVASTLPPVVQFTSVSEKDSLRNIRATGEFVINLASVELFEKINSTGATFEPSIDEFRETGVESEPSHAVHVPRVARSPLALECTLRDIIPVGNSYLVLGDVVCATVVDHALSEQKIPLVPRLEALARLQGLDWAFPGEIQSLARPSL